MHRISLDDPGDSGDVREASIVVPASLQRAVDRRLRGYVGGRYCAQEALVACGAAAPLDIGIGPMGAPQWPQGFVGSISHSRTTAIAVVAPASAWLSLGIDTEPIIAADVLGDIVDRVLPEAAQVEFLTPAGAPPPWPVVVTAAFSGKESIYKCFNPLVRRFFEFDAVRLQRVDTVSGILTYTVCEPLGDTAPTGTQLSVRYCTQEAQVFTIIAEPHRR